MIDTHSKKNADIVIVVTGPTASGKSSVAVELAIRLGGEVICADSMQIYKFMDIGTAKTGPADRKGIPHHMMDIIEPSDDFSVAAYKEMSTRIIRDIQSRGKVAIVCGGTGQYISSLIEGTTFIPQKTDSELRERLEKEYEEKGADYIYDKLTQIDPDTAKLLHPNDKKRIIRAMEIFHTTGMTKTQMNIKSKINGPDFEFLSFCITHDREILYERINTRVDGMMNDGLLDEVRMILDKYPNLSKTARQAIGYKELISYIEGEKSLQEAVDTLKQASRNYAKRQLTWFRKMDSLIWLQNTSTDDTVNVILNKCEEECINILR
jgi:tRNA dimethylallyltransferase